MKSAAEDDGIGRWTSFQDESGEKSTKFFRKKGQKKFWSISRLKPGKMTSETSILGDFSAIAVQI
jgi:hypothetical protein